MSDLIAMHPNLKIPLYLVVPDERKNKVITEVNRPTFSRLSPPLSQICRLITFSILREQVQQLKPNIVANLKPNFIKDLSEPCKQWERLPTHVYSLTINEQRVKCLGKEGCLRGRGSPFRFERRSQGMGFLKWWDWGRAMGFKLCEVWALKKSLNEVYT